MLDTKIGVVKGPKRKIGPLTKRTKPMRAPVSVTGSRLRKGGNKGGNIASTVGSFKDNPLWDEMMALMEADKARDRAGK